MIIHSLEIDTSDMPTGETVRAFTINGEVGADFTLLAIESGTIKYYDFVDEAFELGHNNMNNNLKVTLSGRSYSGNIKFPSGGGTYIIKLIASPGTEVTGSNKLFINKSIDKQAADAVVTFTAATATTTAANYATFPTTTSTGGSTSTGNFDFDWDIENASTDAGGFTTTDTVNGAITSSKSVVVDDTTDIVVGMTISGVSSGSLSGLPVILSVNTTTKTLTFNIAQTFADGITLTFKANGAKVIKDAIGLDIIFTQYPTVTPTVLTQNVRTDAGGTTINIVDTHGISGGNIIGYTGFGVDNSGNNKVTSVTADVGGGDSNGSIVVQRSQTLPAGTVLTFRDIYKKINFVGNIVINSYPNANRTIYLDLDKLITVGTAS